MSGRIVQMSNVLMNNKNVHFQSFYSIAIVRVVVRNALSSSRTCYNRSSASVLPEHRSKSPLE